MKYISIPLLFIFIVCACAPDTNDGSDTQDTDATNLTNSSSEPRGIPNFSALGYPNDLTIESPEVASIKAEVDSLNARLKKIRTPTEMIALNVHSNRDQLGFWKTDDNMGKITFRIASKEFEVNPTYIMKDGNLIYYHHRDWQKENDPHIHEMYVYFDNGKLLYAEERSIKFERGKGMPTMLMNTPFEKSTRTEAEIMEDLNEYWTWAPVAERAAQVLNK